MNQTIKTERRNGPSDSRGTRGFRTAAIATIILVAILASAVSAYSTTNPTSNVQTLNGSRSQTTGDSVTVSVRTSQSRTRTTVTVTTESITVTTRTHSYPNPPPGYPSYPGYYYPGYPGYYPGYAPYAYGGCSYSTPYSNTVQCDGYVYQAPNGCVELVVQVTNPYYGTYALQYYTLQNLSSIPPSGTLVMVQGQMYQGYNTSSTGAACPGNYINATSVTPL